MKFLLLFKMARDAMPDQALSDKCFREMMVFVDELKSSCKLVFDSQVLPESEALRFTRAAGATSVRAGPFLETSETLGGFFVIRAADRDEAVALARRCPHQQVGAVELRPLNESDENAYH